MQRTPPSHWPEWIDPSAPARARLPLIRSLEMTAAIREQILLHLLEETPNEGVGLLAVASDLKADGRARATRFFVGTNLDASPARFTMDPIEVMAAIREIDAQGWRLGAIVHSHLTSPATPSATDLREAHYPDSLLLIVSFQAPPAMMRAWRIDYEDEMKVVRGVPIDVLPVSRAARSPR